MSKKKHRRIRIRRKAPKAEAEEKPKAKTKTKVKAMAVNQKAMYGKPKTTIWCPQSLNDEEIFEALLHPEYFMEINMVSKNRTVDAFYIPAHLSAFKYKKKTYKVDEDNIYLLPTKNNIVMPTSYYREDETKPKGFKQLNKGITGKALSLLYMQQLYTSLLYAEENKYNFFIVILSIASLIAYGVGLYLLFGLFTNDVPVPQLEALIKVI